MSKENISAQYDWVSRVLKRFVKIGRLKPELQMKVYKSIRDNFVAGKTVLDVGCELGIGSNILSHKARSVWGIDVNEKNIEFTRQAFKRPNLDFEVIDIENPPERPLANFEVVVVSEVIEHLVDVNQGLGFIKSFFSNKLKTLGFITIPGRGDDEVRKRDNENDLHLHHWDPGEFYKLMIDNFEQVTLYGADKLDSWGIKETVDGNTKSPLIVAKVERPK